MKPWRPGDPVGRGVVYLPDQKTRDAYWRAVNEALIDSAARHVISLPSIEARREYIERHRHGEALKARVSDLWRGRNRERGQ